MMDQAVSVTIAIFLAGVIYYGGRLTARVESLEDWRDEFKEQFKESIEELKALIRGDSA